MSRLYITGLFIAFSLTCFSQNKVLNYLNYGDEKYKKGDVVNALDYYKQALDLDSNSVAINWKYAEALKAYKDYEKAAHYYGIVYQKEGTKIYPASLINYALMVKQTGDYDQAISLFKKAKTIYANDKKSYFYLKSKRELEACLWAKSTSNLKAECITNPLPSSVNTENSEFGHSIYNGTFYFSSLRADSINSKEEVFTTNYTTSLFQSKQTKDSFEESQKITSLVAGNINIGNGTFSLDKTRFYFSICKNDNFNYSCKIAVANFKDGVWSSVDTLGEIINATGANTTMPHIANWDGTETLFFASDREGTEGGMDIWYSQLKNGNQFSKVRSVKEINTVDNDLCPWWDEKSNALYFSSSWYNGFGGLDIFKSTYNNQFSAPENIGKPFNSSANDLYYFQQQDTAYLSSNRKGVKFSKNPTCCSDIFSVVPFRKEIDSTELITSIETFETLMKRLPVTLYFHNDVPNPKSTDTTTTLNYLTTYAEYTKLLSTYQEEYSEGLIPEKAQIAKEEIESFFIEYVDQGVKDLSIFSDLLFKELQKGTRIKLIIKGFASPLAKSDYNVKLTKRRIASLKNYLAELENGEFSTYIENGTLQFVEVPFGENNANKMTSDNFHDQKNSVYSKAAAVERKIEIISIERIN
jgi:tetratricopeptide (TPR) repeat protein